MSVGDFLAPPSKSIFKSLKAKFGKKADDERERDDVRYQWFWAGTQNETKKLTPDLTQSVKRHVVVKRIIDSKEFPTERVKAARFMEAAEKEERIKSQEQGVSAEKLEKIREATIKAKEEWALARANGWMLKHLLCFDFKIQVCLQLKDMKIKS